MGFKNKRNKGGMNLFLIAEVEMLVATGILPQNTQFVSKV